MSQFKLSSASQLSLEHVVLLSPEWRHAPLVWRSTLLRSVLTCYSNHVQEEMRETTADDFRYEDLERLPTEELARITEWLTEKVDALSTRLKAEPKEDEVRVQGVTEWLMSGFWVSLRVLGVVEWLPCPNAEPKEDKGGEGLGSGFYRFLEDDVGEAPQVNGTTTGVRPATHGFYHCPRCVHAWGVLRATLCTTLARTPHLAMAKQCCKFVHACGLLINTLAQPLWPNPSAPTPLPQPLSHHPLFPPKSQDDDDAEAMGDVDLFALVNEGHALTVNSKWLQHLEERLLGEDGHPRKARDGEDPHR